MFGLSVAVTWLLAGALLMALEAFGIPGVGMLFAGLAAILVGILVQVGLVGEDALIVQFGLFCALTAICAAVLWGALKRWRTSPDTADSYHNMIGDRAVVGAGGLRMGARSQVTWSGTLMEAELDPTSAISELPPETLVEITAVKGNRLIVKPI